MNVITVSVDFSEASDEDHDNFWDAYNQCREGIREFLEKYLWDWGVTMVPGTSVEIEVE